MDDPLTEQSHVDFAAFWRDAFTKSQETQIALRARISELESRNGRSLEPENRSGITTASLRRRKRDLMESTDASSGKSQKKARTVTWDPLVDGRDFGDLTSDTERRTTDDVGDAFLHHLYILQQLQLTEDPSPQGLATTLCDLSSSICGIVSTVQSLENPRDSTTTTVRTATNGIQQQVAVTEAETNEKTKTRLVAIGRTFPYLLRCLHRLSQAPGAPAFRGRAIYSYINVFRHILSRICDLATHPAQGTVGKLKAKQIRTRAQTSQYQQPAIAPSTEVLAFSRNISRLCDLAIRMLGCLDTAVSTHNEILEGFQHFLLKKVGRGLAGFVFGFDVDGMLHHQTDNGSRSENHSGAEGGERDTQEAMEFQAPYLIRILDRAQTLIGNRSHFAAAVTAPASDENSNQTALPSFAASTLSNSTRARLQHTLLKGVFGHLASAAPADFEPSLECPSPPPQDHSSSRLGPVIDTIEVKDWYKHEVWRILGWDVLSGQIQWNDK